MEYLVWTSLMLLEFHFWVGWFSGHRRGIRLKSYFTINICSPLYIWSRKRLVWMVIQLTDGSMMAPNCFFCHRFSNAKNTAQCSEKYKICKMMHNYNFIMTTQSGIDLFSNYEIIHLSLENVFRIENIFHRWYSWIT